MSVESRAEVSAGRGHGSKHRGRRFWCISACSVVCRCVCRWDASGTPRPHTSAHSHGVWAAQCKRDVGVGVGVRGACSARGYSACNEIQTSLVAWLHGQPVRRRPGMAEDPVGTIC